MGTSDRTSTLALSHRPEEPGKTIRSYGHHVTRSDRSTARIELLEKCASRSHFPTGGKRHQERRHCHDAESSTRRLSPPSIQGFAGALPNHQATHAIANAIHWSSESSQLRRKRPAKASIETRPLLSLTPVAKIRLPWRCGSGAVPSVGASPKFRQ